MITIGFDIGGTFTDIVVEDDATRKMTFLKVPTSTGRPAEGVATGLDMVLERLGLGAGDVAGLLHATTIATNAILERKGSLTGLITTEGFRDVLLIGRQKRYNTYDLYLDKPEPLTRRRHIAEVSERISYAGEVLAPLDLATVDRCVEGFLASGIETVAVALLHAYANPAHERAVRARIQELAPHLSVSLSSDVSAKIREYERTSTTVANAYVKPIVADYIGDLRTALSARGLPTDLHIMQSNGGLVTPELASEFPVRIVESGPAAGVLMAARVGQDEGVRQVLTFDMGGTTAKLGAVDDGEPVIAPGFEVDARHFRKFSGLPLNIQAIELLEIGAGGGSIASTEAGLIRVGPKSAGAYPGPICYMRGGTAPTVTDANLVLGYLDAAHFNAGAMTLDLQGARAGIAREIATPLGLSVEEAAWGIHAVANSNMETAMRVISVERGRDPRLHVLVAFGGAGPLHAARLARSMRIPRVIVPIGAGVGSAIGLMNADHRVDASLTRILHLSPATVPQIGAILADLERDARAELARLSEKGNVRWLRQAYMRHVGQGFEIKVDLPETVADPSAYVTAARMAFQESYRQIYGYVDDDAEIEGVDWLVTAISPSRAGEAAPASHAPPAAGLALKGARPVYFPEAGGFLEAQVIDRYAMVPGEVFAGPAVVEEGESTTIVLPGDTVALSPSGHLVVTIDQRS
ncbi:hydantoinase/oxoprolinase family protein [Xanthobacter dioxanivorans]|uniref:Hydantoinase/oxoprolinase family protein n=1 Tax=Xanthobacter dioxanivorans TaxID=2528964 RepID=A0A974PM13_9HYPH|nr:hydantoinase/oxoprolinase family protein [Xanthobacter dioxanivorans]QRG06057.1 hydantoinase/oxoprolinase family protein [Xanthobacter dioxanivorans]